MDTVIIACIPDLGIGTCMALSPSTASYWWLVSCSFPSHTCLPTWSLVSYAAYAEKQLGSA